MTDEPPARLRPAPCRAQLLAGRASRFPLSAPPPRGAEPALEESVGVGTEPRAPSFGTQVLSEQLIPGEQAPLSSSPSQSSSKRLHVSNAGGPGRQSLGLQLGL